MVAPPVLWPRSWGTFLRQDRSCHEFQRRRCCCRRLRRGASHRSWGSRRRRTRYARRPSLQLGARATFRPINKNGCSKGVPREESTALVQRSLGEHDAFRAGSVSNAPCLWCRPPNVYYDTGAAVLRLYDPHSKSDYMNTPQCVQATIMHALSKDRGRFAVQA